MAFLKTNGFGDKNKMLRQRLRLIPSQKQAQLQEEFNSDDYDFLDLGVGAYGVSNDEGYSKIYVSLGRLRTAPSTEDYTVVRLVEKYFYTNAQTSHQEEESFYNWEGNLFEYLNENRRKLWQ